MDNKKPLKRQPLKARDALPRLLQLCKHALLCPRHAFVPQKSEVPFAQGHHLSCNVPRNQKFCVG